MLGLRRRVPGIVLIDGPPGAGKTTMAWELARTNPGVVGICHLDELGITLDLRRKPRDMLDLAALERRVLKPARAGRPPLVRTEPDGPVHRVLVDLLVIEGVFAFELIPDAPTAWRIWVDTPPEVCAARLAERGGLAVLADAFAMYRLLGHPEARAHIRETSGT